MSSLNKNSVLLSRIEAEKKAVINKLNSDKEKTILLIEAPQDYRTIKEALGWTEDSIDNSNKLGEAVQELSVYEKYPDSIILSSSDLVKFCVGNGYSVSNIAAYKGPTSKELLSKIDDYCKVNEITPGVLHQNHLILYPSYLETNSKEQVIKNRQVKVADEIFVVRDVLEKQLNEHYYEVVVNVGTPSYIKARAMEFFNHINIFTTYKNFLDDKLMFSFSYTSVTIIFTLFVILASTLCDGNVPTSYSDVLVLPAILMGIGLIINYMPEMRDVSTINYTKIRDSNVVFYNIYNKFFRNQYDQYSIVDDEKIKSKITSSLYKRYFIYTFLHHLIYYIIIVLVSSTIIYFVAGKTYTDKDRNSAGDTTDNYSYKVTPYEQSTFPLFKQVGSTKIIFEPR